MRKSKGNFIPMLAALLFIIGTAAIFVPPLTMNSEVARDEEAYAELRTRAKGDSVTEEAPEAAAFPGSKISLPASMVSPSPTAGKTGVDVAACKAQNNDFVAWLQIPGTPIDYPVVSTYDTKYYLSHTFTGKKSYLGTLFSLGKTDYQLPSRNIAIYGHHIRSNDAVMFSPLLAYKDESYYAGHELIHLDSLYHSGTYRIFAVINMRSGDWEPSTASFASGADFLAFVNQARAQALYETDVEVTEEDEILTLITCDRRYLPVLGRLVVMAVKEEPFKEE